MYVESESDGEWYVLFGVRLTLIIVLQIVITGWWTGGGGGGLGSPHLPPVQLPLRWTPARNTCLYTGAGTASQARESLNINIM